MNRGTAGRECGNILETANNVTPRLDLGVSHSIFLSLSLLTCKIGIIILMCWVNK